MSTQSALGDKISGLGFGVYVAVGFALVCRGAGSTVAFIVETLRTW